jgi:signal transduction histidine kinase
MTVSPISQAVVRVLLVEDNPADAELIRETLDDGSLDPAFEATALRLEQVDRLVAAFERLAAGEIDVVLLDLSLPDSHGIDTFVRLVRSAPRTPIVVLSGLDDEAMAIRAVREGAQDYLVKGQVDNKTLTRSIHYAVERRRAEDERAGLARARAEAEASLRARDETLATISHDLRTPLTSIRGLAQLLQRRLARGAALSTEELTDRLERIEEQTALMARMIDDLLDVARIEAGRPLELHRESCDLVALAQKTAADVQRTTDRHRLQVVAEAQPIVGAVDCARLERVLLNLLTNAVKYCPDGGDVDLTLRPERRSDGDWAILAVRDGGIGIPPADLPRIFERFYRASNVGDQLRGTGLGLAGAQQIVEQHGGEINVASDPGVGTTFTVRLPLDNASGDQADGTAFGVAET